MAGLKLPRGLRVSGIRVEGGKLERKACVWRMGYSKHRLRRGEANDDREEGEGGQRGRAEHTGTRRWRNPEVKALEVPSMRILKPTSAY